jgi:histone chaperone ASF1
LDQELDDCLVGPIPVGVNAFEFEGSSPKPSVIPPEDVLGVAALILTGSYKDQEFVRVGYYQNTEYEDDELKESPPKNVMFEKLVRDISAKPRVTRFQIKWCVTLPIPVLHCLDAVLVVLKGRCAATDSTNGRRCCNFGSSSFRRRHG